MKSSLHTSVLGLILASLLDLGNSYRILGVFPVRGRSHFSCNYSIMRSLHAVGHHITMISPFPSEEKLENFTVIDVRQEHHKFVFVGRNSTDDFIHMSLNSYMGMITTAEEQYCREILNFAKNQKAFKSSEKLYDVMFVETHMAYECFLPIAEKLGVPVIGTVTYHSWIFADQDIGLPNNPAVIPLSFLTYEIEMNIIQRIRNLWNNFIMHYYYKIRMRKLINALYQEYFPDGLNLLYKKDISLMFYNNHPSLQSRPMTPNAVEIGGIHLKPAKPLPQDLKIFIDEAVHGVVIFSLGSIVKGSSISYKQKQAFLSAFASIPQRVIWKYEEPISDLPENVFLLSWFPQRDILEHKNVIVFMSHCGQSGVIEGVVTSTPVICIPLFSDQPKNAALLVRRGVSVILDLQTVTKEVVLNALNQIINDTSYYQRMQALSQAYKDRPMTPQESVVYWTEYVIRHNGTPYLKALGTDMPLYKYLMLDIIALAFLTMGIIIFTVYKTLTRIHQLRKPKHVPRSKKDD